MPIYKTKNENFFKKWTAEMAYVLGFFAADGCMIRNNRGAHFIEFQITDKDILLKIKKLLGSNHKITERKNNIKWKIAYRLQIGSKAIFEDLLLLGMTPTKSKTIKFPEIPERYISHFVRGYFDGDGNVSMPNYIRADRKNKLSTTLLSGFTSGSKKFLIELHSKLKALAGIVGGTLCYHGGAFRLFFSVKDSAKLYEFMYAREDELFLLRKKKVFEKYLKLDW
ncbi:MAG: LAGLIDADG family homing endonuclease [Candidatus Moraniibacteriota bacterium]